MTTLKISKVAEHPARSSSSGRSVFSNGYLWVVYVAEDMTLTLAQYNQSSVDATQFGNVVKTSVVDKKVARWASPCLMAFNGQLAVIYQTGQNPRLLKLVVLDYGHNVVKPATTLSQNPGYEILFTCYQDQANDLSIIAGQFSRSEHNHTDLLQHVLDHSTYEITTTALDLRYGQLSSLVASKDANDVTQHIIYSTTARYIYRMPVSSLGTPELIHTTPIIVDPADPTKTYENIIVELTSISRGSDSCVIYSSIIKGKPIYPRLFQVFNSSPAVELPIQAGEAMSHVRAAHTGADQHSLFCVTQNVSAHPRTLFTSTLTNAFTSAPSLELVDYRQPLGLRALSLELGQSLLSTGLADHIQAGTILLEDVGSPNAILCYFDPKIQDLTFKVSPSAITDQARGVSGTPSTKTVSITASNPEGLPIYYSWTSSSAQVSFSDAHSASPTVYFTYLAPDTSTLTLKASYGSTQETFTIPVTMAVRTIPSLVAQAVSTAWHTPIKISLEILHDSTYPVSLVCSSDAPLAFGTSEGDLPCGRTSKIYTTYTSVPGGSVFDVWVMPWHVDILGGTYTITVSIVDELTTVSSSIPLTVGAFPAEILGTGFIKKFKYNGNLRTADDGLGYITSDPVIGLKSDFTSVRRLLWTGVLYHVFLGSHAALWVSNWTSGAHTYLVSYPTCPSMAVNKFGETACLSASGVSLFLPIDQVVPVTTTGSGEGGIPPKFTYQDIPHYFSTLEAFEGDPVQIKETNLSSVWAVITTRSVGVVTSERQEVFDSVDLGLGPDDRVCQIHQVSFDDSMNGYLIIFVQTGSNYFAVHVSLTDRRCSTIWRGDSLASFISK